MTRHYAYALGGNRAVDSAPLCKPKNTTILSSIQANRIYHYTTFPSGTTVARFKDYLENDLIPYLSKTSVLVMDNMKSHHAKAVKELLDKSGIHCLYLPPYSPDLNPIEKLWSKVKAILRKLKARTADALPDAFQTAFAHISQSDCAGCPIVLSCTFWSVLSTVVLLQIENIKRKEFYDEHLFNK